MKKNNTCFVAGRSGGHLIPALTLAAQEKKKHPDIKILFFSASTTLDKKLTKNAEIIDWHMPLTLQNVPGKKIHKYPSFFLNFLRSFLSAYKYLKKIKPQKVVSTGGYITLPVACAAKLLSIPLHLYELNAIPGRATKFLAPWAEKVHVCFVQTGKHLPKSSCTFTQYPNRFENLTLPEPQTVSKYLNFCPKKKTVLILGGSQGSLFLNKQIGQWLTNNPQLHDKVQIIHQTGALDKTDWSQTYKNLGIAAHVFDFCDNVQDHYQIADLVICRSGAGSLFETLHFGKKCITIPLETKQNDHQVQNAIEMQKIHPDLFTVVRQKDMRNLFYVNST